MPHLVLKPMAITTYPQQCTSSSVGEMGDNQWEKEEVKDQAQAIKNVQVPLQQELLVVISLAQAFVESEVDIYNVGGLHHTIVWFLCVWSFFFKIQAQKSASGLAYMNTLELISQNHITNEV